jgi:hypothetical protein
MKLYLASRYDRRIEMAEVAERIEQLGHRVTSRWIAGNGRPNGESARYDLTDVLVADGLVLFTEEPTARVPFAARGGRHVEFGYALKAGKKVFIVGPRENIFHALPEVVRFPDTGALLEHLGDRRRQPEVTTPSTTPRRGLTSDEQALLLSHVWPFLRTATLYVLALKFGLGARELTRLNIGDVSRDGKRPDETLWLRSGTLPLFAGPVSAEVARLLARYLAWRCSCVHLKLPLQTYRDAACIERCHACHDGLDHLANPLFIGRTRRRLSAKRVRHEFAEHRDELDLDPMLSFDSLRLSYEATQPAVGNA